MLCAGRLSSNGGGVGSRSTRQYADPADVWSHGILFVLTGPISDFREHRRDRCTWAGLKIPQGHCPPLPGRLLNGEQTV